MMKSMTTPSTNGRDDGEKKYPLFLNKTYAMLKASRPDVATWSEDGLSFYIIDQNRFVETVIPQYFKHSNFSSFVRQLNFYGFRKVWSDQLIEMQQSGFEKVLEFKHPFFQRDNPELLSRIRKIVNGSDMSKANCDNNDIVALKSDVEELKVHLYMLSNKLVMLSNSVTQLLELKSTTLPPAPSYLASLPSFNTVMHDDAPSPKKRKIDPPPGFFQLGMEIASAPLTSSSSSSSSSSTSTFSSIRGRQDKE